MKPILATLITISSFLTVIAPVAAQNFLTDSDNAVPIGSLTEDQLLTYGFFAILGIIIVTAIASVIKKKNSPHIKTDLKEGL